MGNIAKEITLDVIKRLPKVDAHRHLDGSIRIATLLELAREQGVVLPTNDVDELAALIRKDKNCTGLVNFLEAFHYTLRVLQKAYAITRVFYEICEDAVADGLKYLEVRFSPILHIEDGLSLSEVMEAVVKGLSMAELALPIKVRIIVCGLRHLAPSITKDLAEIAWRYKQQGVAAFDLAGPENGFSSVKHKEAFHIIRNKGINCTLHSGEDSNYLSVYDSISHCGAHRIGHGIAVRESAELLDFMVNRRIPIECCITSNFQIKGIPTVADHPIRKFFDAGVIVVICCDNCTMSNIDVSHEYKLAVDNYGFTVEEVIRLIDYSFASTFLEAPMKSMMRRDAVIQSIKIFKEAGYNMEGVLNNRNYYLEGPGIIVDEILNHSQITNLFSWNNKYITSNDSKLPEVTLEMLQNLPKSDLHATFDGSVSVETMWLEYQLLEKMGGEQFEQFKSQFSTFADINAFRKTLQSNPELHYTQSKNMMNSLLQTKEQIQRGFDDIIDLALKDKVHYLEIAFRPYSHTKAGLSAKEALECLLQCKEARDKRNENIEIHFIVNASSDCDGPIECYKLAKLAVSQRERGVIAFGIFGQVPIKGDEIKHFERVFSYLKNKHFSLAQTAGNNDIESMFSTIHDAGAQRLSGAFQIHKIPRFLSYISNYKIPIEISLTDRLKQLTTKDISFTTPIRHLLDSNVPAVICSFRNTLYPFTRSEMLFEIVKYAQLNLKQTIRLLKNSFSYSFKSQKERFNSSIAFNEEAKAYLKTLNINFEDLLIN